MSELNQQSPLFPSLTPKYIAQEKNSKYLDDLYGRVIGAIIAVLPLQNAKLWKKITPDKNNPHGFSYIPSKEAVNDLIHHFFPQKFDITTEDLNTYDFLAFSFSNISIIQEFHPADKFRVKNLYDQNFFQIMLSKKYVVDCNKAISKEEMFLLQ
jgi:hypothetical protein